MLFGINALSVKPGVTGGGETYLRELVSHLALVDRENEYRVFVSRANHACFLNEAPNVQLVVSPFAFRGTSQRIAIEQLWLPLACRSAGLDVLLCPTDTVPLIHSGRTVMTVQNLLHFHPEFRVEADRNRCAWSTRLQKRVYRLLVHRSAVKATAVLAVSEQTRREVVNSCDIALSRVAVAHHGVSSRFRRVDCTGLAARLISDHKVRPPYLLIVGSLSPYKNIECAIKALAHLRLWMHDLPMLVLAGDDRFQYRPKLERLAEELDVAAKVRFIGIAPYGDLPSLYSGATVAISLSSCESFGLPVLEAMACGCPVICANRSSLPEVAGDAALLVDPHRPELVAKAIWLLLSRPELRSVYSELGVLRARLFDWQRTARITRDVLVAVALGKPLPWAGDLKTGAVA